MFKHLFSQNFNQKILRQQFSSDNYLNAEWEKSKLFEHIFILCNLTIIHVKFRESSFIFWKLAIIKIP
jgi:hypothetical protein